MDFPSFSALFDIGRVTALKRNSQLSRDAIDREGSDANILVATAAAVGDEVVGNLVNVSAGLYLDSATGDALDRLLADRYGLLRKTATAGVGTAQFSLPTANPATFTVPTGTQMSTPDGIKYETTAAVLFLAGQTSVSAPIRSLLAGASQQIKPLAINSLLSQVPFAPTTLTVTNTLATAGAVDRESDTDYRARGRAFFSTTRRGTLSAIEQGALSVPGVVTATAFESYSQQGNPQPIVQCIISDQYTEALANLSVTPPAYAAQSQQLAAAVVEALRDYRPAGIFVYVQVAAVALTPIVLALRYIGGVDTVTVGNEARAAVVNYVNNLSPGDPLDPDALIEVLSDVEGLIITGNEVLVPTGEIVPGSLQVLRTSPNIVTLQTADGEII